MSPDKQSISLPAQNKRRALLPLPASFPSSMQSVLKRTLTDSFVERRTRYKRVELLTPILTTQLCVLRKTPHTQYIFLIPLADSSLGSTALLPLSPALSLRYLLRVPRTVSQHVNISVRSFLIFDFFPFLDFFQQSLEVQVSDHILQVYQVLQRSRVGIL